MEIIKTIVEEIINTINDELAHEQTSSTRYRCREGNFIHTDVGYVADWFDEYVGVLRKRYNIEK